MLHSKEREDNYLHKGLRKQLVDGLRSKGIKDERVLAAIEAIPRHFFLDPAFERHAYEDKAFPITAGQTISQPYTVAYQTQLLEIKKFDKVLEVGTGSAYQACVLAELGIALYSIERQKELYDYTGKFFLLKKYPNIKRFYGDGFEGLPSYAQFDKIIITCGAPFVPPKLLEQLKPGGKYYEATKNVPAGTDINDPNYWALIEKPTTLGDIGSSRNKDLAINDALVVQANVEVPLSGYDNVSFYIIPLTPNGQPSAEGLFTDQNLVTVDGTQLGEGTSPQDFGWTIGYLTGDNLAPNGLPVTPGVSFPHNPSTGDYCLRLDYSPNRLFRYSGALWVAISEDVRTPLDWGPENKTQRSSFVNNTYTVNTSDQGNIPSRQSLSELLRPQADNGNDGGNLPPNPRPPGK